MICESCGLTEAKKRLIFNGDYLCDECTVNALNHLKFMGVKNRKTEVI